MVDHVQQVQKEIEGFYLPHKVKEGKLISGLTVKEASKAINGNAFQKLIARIRLLFKTDKKSDKSSLQQLFSFNNKVWYNEKKVNTIVRNLDYGSLETLSLKFNLINYAEYTNRSLLVFKNKPLNKTLDEKTCSGFVTFKTVDKYKEFTTTLNNTQQFNLQRLTREGFTLVQVANELQFQPEDHRLDEEAVANNIENILEDLRSCLEKSDFTIDLICNLNVEFRYMDKEAVKELKDQLKKEVASK